MRVDRESAVGCGEGFGDGDEVEEGSGKSGGDCDVPPARPVIERGGQYRERGYAVEDHRDS